VFVEGVWGKKIRVLVLRRKGGEQKKGAVKTKEKMAKKWGDKAGRQLEGLKKRGKVLSKKDQKNPQEKNQKIGAHILEGLRKNQEGGERRSIKTLFADNPEGVRNNNKRTLPPTEKRKRDKR